jgi:hypothetical protein
MAMEKRYHSTVLVVSQKCKSALKRTGMVLHADYVTTLERRADMWTTLFLAYVSSMSLAPTAFSINESASTHLECYRGASRCVLIGGMPIGMYRTKEMVRFGSSPVRIEKNLVRNTLERESTAKEQESTVKFGH